MNATLEDRLRQHYADRTTHLPQQGPGLDTVVVRSGHYVDPTRNRSLGGRVALVAGLAAAAVAVVLVAVNRGDTPSVGTSSTPTADATVPPNTVVADALAPAVTLPPSADLSDTPVTVAAVGPSNWYRLQPDLDVAWYRNPDNQSPSMFCWRTPVITDCVADQFPPHPLPPMATGGGQVLVVVSGDWSQDTVRLETDSETLTAPISWDPVIGWGVARFSLPAGMEITTVGGKVVPSAPPPSTAEAVVTAPAYPAVTSPPADTAPGISG
jgi:hypothetical protein